jgi:hypothetical protein
MKFMISSGFALMLILTGCGSTRPLQPPQALSCNLTDFRVNDIYENWRVYRATTARTLSLDDKSPSFNVLSLSAGGQFGAYGAGFLLGWGSVGSAARPGPRQDIQVVTGVSTGALLATHAFLGLDKKADAKYRNLSGEQVYKSRWLVEYLWADSLLNTAGKDEIVAEIVSSEIIDQVAAQSGQGRFLFLGMVNLDSGEFVRIDMVKLAGSLKPKEHRDACYRAVVGASSAIPVAFSPKFIDGRMWVDGGTRRHLFLTQPPQEAMGNVTRRLYSIVHGDLAAGEEEVKNGVLQIAGRASTVLTDQGMKDSIRIQDALASACPAGVDCGGSKRMFETRYAAAAEAASFCAPKLRDCDGKGNAGSDDIFCNAFMQCLADRGRQDGIDYARGTRQWLTLDDLCLGSKPNCQTAGRLKRLPFQ